MEGRLKILEYLKKELIGPVDGLNEVLDSVPPHKRYTLGVLFPVDTSIDNELIEEEDESRGIVLKEDTVDDPVTLSGQWMPSSMGLSFFFQGDPELIVEAYGSIYEKIEGSSVWVRQSVFDKQNPDIQNLSPGLGSKARISVLNGAGEINVHWRSLGGGYLVTITLVNSKNKITKDVKGEDCICQAGFRCAVKNGEIREYPSTNILTTDIEEQELQVIYRQKKVYAVGHGCSANWDTERQFPGYLKTEVLPTAYVPGIDHNIDENPDILLIKNLADTSREKRKTINELVAFCGYFEKWIASLPLENSDIPGYLEKAKNGILNKLGVSLGRMKDGINILQNNEDAWKAFQLANLAMLIQMRHSKTDLAGGVHEKNSIPKIKIDYLSLNYRWRPFQLAFQLLSLESIVNENSSFREVVDLIWFPTGGGKTEAYLTLAAFEIFLRRIKFGSKGGGTAVITRYTLRLLTTQQFQRSARLIVACEYLRRQNVQLLGSDEISIGFWAGGDTSPNTFNQALKSYIEMEESGHPSSNNPFQIHACPWCGTRLLPDRTSNDKSEIGFRCDNISFEVFCPSNSCIYHSRLPVSTVDEALYKQPPSFLIATVDKFARLAWLEDGGAFFGHNNEVNPPSLVIQDELHLLSGPLGTTVGLYESAFDGLMAMSGARPKIIASTATIRNADSQVQRLFGRKVSLFPASGLNANNSFFAREDLTNKGRLYLGIMSANHRATTSVVRTAAALLQALNEVKELSALERDSYWTLVMYHMSLRELGKTVSFARDDIPARMKIIASADERLREIFDDDILELTSNLNAAEIPESLKRMEYSYDHPNSVSIVACTNMLSVGVDVPRLGLMMVNGQPKTTSEYIQASSRVGRGAIPGLVITHYSASKPRDRSHYENFLPYHNSLYRFVEPASVTPFSLPSRNRALHAALVIMVRHGAGYQRNEDAAEFDLSNPDVARVIDILLAQAALKDAAEFENTRTHLMRLAQVWHDRSRDAKKEKDVFMYSGKGKQIKTLLRDFGETSEGWQTLHSMRSVDPSCSIKIIGE